MGRVVMVSSLLAGVVLAGCSKNEKPGGEEVAEPVPMQKVFARPGPASEPSAPEQRAGPDIDALADAAYHRPAGTEGGAEGAVDDKNALWAAVFKLKAWLVLMSPQATVKGPAPHVTEHDGQRWVMAFTDPDKLRAYAKEHDLAGEHGEVRMLSLRVPLAMKWLASLQEQGIHGVRFNQGPHGWYAPLTRLEPIRTFLEGKGLLR